MTRFLRLAKNITLICIVIGLLSLLLLPYLCNRVILPRILKDLPFSSKKIEILSISPWSLEGSCTLADQGEALVTIPYFQLRYSPTGLLHREIDTLLLQSPTVRLETNQNGISLKGQQQSQEGAQKKGSTSPASSLPIALHKISIQQGRITLTTKERDYQLSVMGESLFSFTPNGKSQRPTGVVAHLKTEGDLHLDTGLEAVLSADTLQLKTNSNLTLDGLVPLLFPAEDIALEGEATLRGSLSLDTSMQLKALEMDLVLNDFQGQAKELSIGPGRDGANPQLHLEGDPSGLHLTSRNLGIKQPVQAGITLDGSYSPDSKTFMAQMELLEHKGDHLWSLRVTGDHMHQAIRSHFTLQTPAREIQEKINISGAEAQGSLTVAANGTVSGTISGTLAEIKATGQELAVQDVSWQIPLVYPPQKDQTRGTITADHIRYKGRDLARLVAEIDLADNGLQFKTDLTLPRWPQGKLTCEGAATTDGGSSVVCKLDKTTVTASSLRDLIALPEEIDFDFALSAKAKIALDKRGPIGQLQGRIENGNLSREDIQLSGIATSFRFPDLPDMRSSAAQKLTIEALDAGKIHLYKGRILYTIENPQSLFLEKVRFDWCGGKIETAGLRLAANKKEFDVTLYCDRLHLADLLQQFGLEDTEGEGSLNGRLPLYVGEDGILIDDGFLFSTPGNSGIIHFNNAKQLRQGLPAVQSATLDYSIKALEDFQYNWTKLSFATEGDNLLLTMQLDGKPQKSLPFGYRDGQIVATGKGPGLQHPIRLDMNFRLPFQQLFHYGKDIQSILEKM